MLSKITLVGMNKFSNGHLFDNLTLPEGISSEVFINEVMKAGGEFSLLYPDLDFMKYQIGAWSRKWAKTFERWIKADNFEYEALWNLDVTTVREEVGDNELSGSKSISESSEGTSSGITSGSSSGEGNNEHSKAAYDSGTYQPAEKDENSNSVSSEGSNSGTTNSKSSGSESNKEESKHSITINEKRSGNQGVTMSQELLDAERNVWMWNIYSHMADLFINEFCVCLYQ